MQMKEKVPEDEVRIEFSLGDLFRTIASCFDLSVTLAFVFFFFSFFFALFLQKRHQFELEFLFRTQRS